MLDVVAEAGEDVFGVCSWCCGDFDVAGVDYILIMAYGHSPGDLLRVMRWFRIFSRMFSGWPRVARFMVAL